MIVNVIPSDCRRALDVGCGLGALTRNLRRFVPEVAGIGKDAAARRRAGGAASEREGSGAAWTEELATREGGAPRRPGGEREAQ